LYSKLLITERDYCICNGYYSRILPAKALSLALVYDAYLLCNYRRSTIMNRTSRTQQI